MQREIALLVGIIGYAFVILGGYTAYLNGMFSAKQMRERGTRDGLPFIWHFGMWGDPLIVNPILIGLTLLFADQWFEPVKILISLGIAIGASFLMHWLWVYGKLPSAHNRDRRLTKAGWVHFHYMWFAFLVLSLFYFYTDVPSHHHGLLIMVSTLLGIHWFFGSQIPLGFLAPPWFSERPQRNIFLWFQIAGLWALLAWRTYVMCQQT